MKEKIKNLEEIERCKKAHEDSNNSAFSSREISNGVALGYWQKLDLHKNAVGLPFYGRAEINADGTMTLGLASSDRYAKIANGKKNDVMTKATWCNGKIYILAQVFDLLIKEIGIATFSRDPTKMSKMTGMSRRNLDRVLVDATENNIIKFVYNDIDNEEGYKLNPNAYWTGSENDKRLAIKHYNSDDRTITSISPDSSESIYKKMSSKLKEL